MKLTPGFNYTCGPFFYDMEMQLKSVVLFESLLYVLNATNVEFLKLLSMTSIGKKVGWGGIRTRNFHAN